MLLFISGAEIVFVFFIVLLVFGADRIPSIARTLAKGMTQVRQATNDIKSEIQKSVDVDVENPTKTLAKDFTSEVDKVKKDFDDLGDSIKRDL
ncbi:MAG: twin-arginine translocase TatA/TatE family subunit [Flavobacteriaceae bacterium]|jgi:sec-independent protein translocase protein TatA|nr:twin-arginine translocase TatA/TatE family subunit [Flavobacteriaceae bacterium]MDG1920414.1 twin-arginine translocase TatA/TatE family subunit [Flavobacteriaceae bacterium]